jgi:hypothetical protein
LLLQPLPRYIGVSSESPVVIVVADEDVDVPAYEQEDQVDEASVDFVGGFHSHELHASENLIQA